MAGEDRIGAGYKAIYVGRVNANGYMSGNISAEASNGQLLRMTRLRGAQTFPVSIPDDERVPVPGDDEILVTHTFASGELPSGVMGLAVHNMDFDALAQGTLVEPIGDLRAGAMVPTGRVNSTLCFFMMREAKKYEGNIKGTAAWEWLLVPSCEATPLGVEWQTRTFQPYNYGIAISKSSRAPYGATYTEGLRGTTEMALEPIDADYPGEIYGGFGDGATTSFNLTTAPIFADGNKTHLYINGVKKTYGAGAAGYTISGATLIIGTAPASGAHIGYMQEIAASALS
jgi:hypothetical protein